MPFNICYTVLSTGWTTAIPMSSKYTIQGKRKREAGGEIKAFAREIMSTMRGDVRHIPEFCHSVIPPMSQLASLEAPKPESQLAPMRRWAVIGQENTSAER